MRICRGRRTTQIHALTDRSCCLIAFLLSCGQVPNRVAADTPPGEISAASMVHGDTGYDTRAIGKKIEAIGSAPSIPFKIIAHLKNAFPISLRKP